MLVDSHCHLDFPQFQEDFDQVLERAKAARVAHMVTISTRVRQFQPVLALAERLDMVTCTVGTHPHNAGSETDVTVEELVTLSHHRKVVGIGESGLDYHYDKSPREAQQQGFRTHIQAAREAALPLVVHARDADADIERIMREEGAETSAAAGVMHCFSSGRRLAEAALEMGYMISCSGVVTFKRADELRSIIKDVPLDRLLVETDAPYLAPMPHRGKRNEPAYVRKTAEVVAEVKGVDIDTLESRTTENFARLFAKARPFLPDMPQHPGTIAGSGARS